MPTPVNMKLYEEVKKDADKIYSKPSAYKSGWIVKTYKQRGGTYIDDKKPKNLKRWFMEDWGSVANDKQYPVYRPMKRINSHTPLTPDEIDKKNLKQQIKLKQKIKGEHNLPPFLARGSPLRPPLL